jgi:hypothetical protein
VLRDGDKLTVGRVLFAVATEANDPEVLRQF